MTYPATKELARRIAAARPSDVGGRARERARDAALDTLGVMLAGRGEECAALARRLAAARSERALPGPPL